MIVCVNELSFVRPEDCVKDVVVMSLRVVFQLEDFEGFLWFECLSLGEHYGKHMIFLDFKVLVH